MKKSLLLAAAALFGLAPQASAIVQLTNDNVATEIQDGRVLALQCLDTNGGLWKFWNGENVKSENLDPSKGLLQIEFNGDVKRDGRQTFYLKDYANPTNYISSSQKDGHITWTDVKASAATWTAYVPDLASGYSDWSSKPVYIDKAQNTVRFDNGSTFLNTNNSGAIPYLWGGKGGYSFWYAYLFTEEEAAAMTVENAPKTIQCKFIYESPIYPNQDRFFDGMQFGALEGSDVSQFIYHKKYEGEVNYFNKLELQEGQDFIVSETNNAFKLTLTPTDAWTTDWNKFQADYEACYKFANRASLRPEGNTETYISYSYLIEGLRSKNTHKLFGASHMWYLDYIGLDMRGYPQVKFMSVQKPGCGLYVPTTGADHKNAKVTDNPTVFSFFYSTMTGAQARDFVLGATDPVTSSIYFLNNRDDEAEGSSVDVVSTWKWSQEGAASDIGCLIRFMALEDAEFDAYQQEVDACGYPEYLEGEGRGNGVDISDKAFAKAKGTKLPEDVTKIFPENVALLLGLRSYLDYTGIAFFENRRINGANGEEDFYGIPGWVQDGEIVKLYNALDNFKVADESTWAPVAQARWDLVNAATQPAVSYDITPGAIFNMVNFEETRGYLVNDGGELRCSVANNHVRPTDNGEPVNDKDFHFTFVKVGDNLYMYNLGAEKFMNAFGPKSDRKGPVAEAITDHTWQFSDVPTVIRGAVAHSGGEHTFSIAAGMTSGSDVQDNPNHQGGITMMNDCERGVLVTLGNSDPEDGSGLYADYVGFVDADEYQAIVEKAEKAIAAVPSETLDWADINGVVNHLTQESHALIAETASDENKAKNGGGHDHIHYVMQNAERQGFEDGKVYNFFVDGTDNALKVNPDTEALEIEQFDGNDPNRFNLKVVEAVAAADVYMDGPTTATYNFIHNIEKVEGEENNVNMSYNGTTEHTLDMSELGKVKLGDQVFVAKAGTGDATTGITEVISTSNVNNVYDLQGRKVAKAGKGLYIINGAKVLVK